MKVLRFPKSPTRRMVVTVDKSGIFIGYQYRTPGGWADDQDSGASLTAEEFMKIFSTLMGKK